MGGSTEQVLTTHGEWAMWAELYWSTVPFVEEKICLTRGANTTQYRLRCDRCHGGLGKKPNQRPIDSYDLQHGRDKLC